MMNTNLEISVIIIHKKKVCNPMLQHAQHTLKMSVRYSYASICVCDQKFTNNVLVYVCRYAPTINICKSHVKYATGKRQVGASLVLQLHRSRHQGHFLTKAEQALATDKQDHGSLHIRILLRQALTIILSDITVVQSLLQQVCVYYMQNWTSHDAAHTASIHTGVPAFIGIACLSPCGIICIIGCGRSVRFVIKKVHVPSAAVKQWSKSYGGGLHFRAGAP